MTENALLPRQGGLPQPANPPTPFHREDLGWATAYMVVHMLTNNSYLWAYILWILLLSCFVIGTIAHRTGVRAGFIGAYWRRYTIRRRTWRWRGEPTSLPSNAQFLSLFALVAAAAILSVAGPDYISSQAAPFQLARRQLEAHTLETRAKYYDPTQFARNQPTYTIAKAFWTAGGRLGMMAFALTPLCIIFALKASPITFAMRLHFDKIAFLHRWSGRLIWMATCIHIVLWSIQLSRDVRDRTGRVAFHYAWLYDKFIYGWIAFGLLTLLILLSLQSLRKTHYNAFYALHVLLAPLTMIMAALHHPPVAHWMVIALALWAFERLYRGAWWLRINGIVSGNTTKVNPPPEETRTEAFEMSVQPSLPTGAKVRPRVPPGSIHEPLFEAHSLSYHHPDTPNRVESQRSLARITPAYSPPTGFAHAELLSGRTVRLTFISPGLFAWAPGQFVLIGIPAVSMLATHPFTVASVCDQQSHVESGRAIVLLVRCKAGWTKDLWDLVTGLVTRREPHPGGEHPPSGCQRPSHGVLLKMYVEGPFGSSVRTRWEQHSSVVIYAGGSGVSFGLSILEYVCLCMAGRNGKDLGGNSRGTRNHNTSRVRLVWLIREFSHLQWCAAALNRCMHLVSPEDLQIDIFVTNFTPAVPRVPRSTHRPAAPVHRNALTPPVPGFARNTSRASSVSSVGSADESSDGDESVTSHVLGEYVAEYGDEDSGDLGTSHNYVLDLTNWDGDNDDQLPGEERLNSTVRKAGKRTRATNSKIASQRIAGYGTRVETRGPDGHHHRTGNSMDGLLSGRDSSDSDSPHDSRGRTPLRLNSKPTLSQSALQALTHAPHAHSPLSPLVPLRADSPISRPESPHGSFVSDTTMRGLLPDSAVQDQVKLSVEGQEMRDMNAVAVNARPGKPRLDRILAEEVERSKGSIAVACCGPSSLSAMVRRAVAAQINPERVRKGDKRGDIVLVAEDYQY